MDALRLAQGTSRTAAIHRLPFGGAKAVLMRPETIEDRTAYFETFGRFVESLGGRYITAPGAGSCARDMDDIARQTAHVTCTTNTVGDPSPDTARGVLRGIEFAVRARLNFKGLKGLRVAIQGAGKVGLHLARQLRAKGVRIWIADIDAKAALRCARQTEAEVVSAQAVYDLPVDVFSPCALSGVLNRETVERLRCSVVAGGADTQLSGHDIDLQLHEAGILYVPDYVINAGGLIAAVTPDRADRQRRIDAIADVLGEVLTRAKRSGRPTAEVADAMAEEMLKSALRAV